MSGTEVSWEKEPIVKRGEVIEISDGLERNIETAVKAREERIDLLITDIKNYIYKMEKALEKNDLGWARIFTDSIVANAKALGEFINEIRLLKELLERGGENDK